jgi:transposase
LLGRRRRHWPKLTAVCDTASHLIAGAVVTRGPSQDSPQFPAAVRQAVALLAPSRLLGDAGYDAEHNHRLCRDILGIPHTVIALNRRNTGRRWPLTPYRREMKRCFPRSIYRQRWHAESIFSRLKRRLGAALTARGTQAQRREILLRVLTHNLMILRRDQRISTKQNGS